MAKRVKPTAGRSTSTTPARPVGVPQTEEARTRGKRPTNLSLDPAAVARGVRYGALYGQKVSQLVNAFLAALPAAELDDAELADLSPAVRRLYGVAAGGSAPADTARDDYRAHLAQKYGSRGG